MITIPLEIGDIVLAGRFKNKKITVKEIGIDDYGNPTVNGRSILKIRIPKLYNIPKGINEMATKVTIKKTDGKYNIYRCTVDGDEETPVNKWPYETEQHAVASAIYKGFDVGDKAPEPHKTVPVKNEKIPLKYDKPEEMKLDTEREVKLERLVRKIIGEMKLNELDVTDDEKLTIKAKRYAELANKMKVLEAELKAMETEYTALDDEFRKMVEAVGKTKDTFIKAGKILIKIERAAYDRDSPKYKTGFDWLHSRVNGVMKELADEAMAMVNGTAKVKSKISVVNTENVITENIFTKIKTWFTGITNKIFNTNKTANSALDKLDNYFK